MEDTHELRGKMVEVKRAEARFDRREKFRFVPYGGGGGGGGFGMGMGMGMGYMPGMGRGPMGFGGGGFGGPMGFGAGGYGGGFGGPMGGYGGGGGGFRSQTNFAMRDGDWPCNMLVASCLLIKTYLECTLFYWSYVHLDFPHRCGNINFARRTKCNKCGAPRPDGLCALWL